MATLLGKIEEFDKSKEDWTQYVEKLSHFFGANGITPPEKKRSVLLLVVSPSTFKTLQSLVTPDKPGEKSHADLVETHKKHSDPKPSEIMQRFKLHTRVRNKPGETVDTYVAVLRALAEHCNFGDLKTLEVMLRDRLYSLWDWR